MSSLRKTLTAIAGLVVLLVATPCLLAQAFPQDSELYGGWGGNQINSRNIPAGSVVDPGSQILYILDTAVNLREQAREESGDDSLGFVVQVNRPFVFASLRQLSRQHNPVAVHVPGFNHTDFLRTAT